MLAGAEHLHHARGRIVEVLFRYGEARALVRHLRQEMAHAAGVGVDGEARENLVALVGDDSDEFGLGARREAFEGFSREKNARPLHGRRLRSKPRARHRLRRALG